MDEGWESRVERAPGQAPDSAPAARPGVPRERSLQRDPGAHWEVPAQQPDTAALDASGVRRLTPVFGTAQPARLASGALRRLAYRIPEQRATRWVLLLAADRVDVLEHRLGRGLWLLPAVGALGAGYALASRVLRRR
ncbi:hypothetical protein [Anaeromyxobacter oryzae]|uniref:Uncharacterized protein n=1 Tax=Anaeromyxobacter oryzae TaxID=2918170 RepID=A0ABN6MZ66_9BACT|nr:hypothetical protein [Anaeromyxobacter oryzae]BDG06236.1 hypothetical protein AMOR_52320 [Anaeromyxobacter oryzae]